MSQGPGYAANAQAMKSAGAETDSVPPIAWVLLVALTFAWGSMWPLLKLAMSEIPLLTFRSGSALLAGLILFAASALAGLRLKPAPGEFPKILLCAGVNVSLWFFLSALAVSYLPAGRAALLAYTMPLWALIIGVVFLKERMTRKRIAGVAAGFCAVLVLSYEDVVAAGSDGLPIGIVAILAAAVTWSTGSILQKNFLFKTPVSVHVSWQFVIGSIPLLALSASYDDPAWIQTVSTPVLLAAASVTLISQSFGLWCWSMILKLTHMGFASIAVLTVPMMSQVLSFLFLGEAFGMVELIGLTLLTVGLATVLPLDGLKALLRG